MAKKILFVDDEADLLRIGTFRLKKAGYAVLTALNGEDALEWLEKETPDLVLLDLRLPVISGQEVCRRIKSDAKLKHIPVILFTASTDQIAEKAGELGAEDYLLKPFEPEVLLEKVRKFIG